MNSKYLVLLMMWAMTLSTANAEGIEFFQGTFEEALDKAKLEGKIVFVDAYTTWCGPCKRMSKNVFPTKEVGDFYNANFISLKLDMEKTPGIRFMQTYPVKAFPTFYFIDWNGEVVMTTRGAKPVDQFITLGKQALKKIDRTADYEKAYLDGDRDPELVYNYIKALNQAGKPSLKVANDYLDSQKNLLTEANLKIILEATTEADSRIFNLLIENKEAISQLTSKNEVNQKIASACDKTAIKALEFQLSELHQEAVTKARKHLPEDEAIAFAIEKNLQYYIATNDVKSYLKSSKDYVKKIAKSDANLLHKHAKELFTNFKENAKAMKEAEKLSKRSAENGGLAGYYMTYANILLHNGKKEDALEAAQKSLKLSEENRYTRKFAEELIRKIEAS